MKRLIDLSLASFVVALLLWPLPGRAVPGQMTYTGYVEDNGKPVKSPGLLVTFKIYPSDMGGNPIWDGSDTVPVTNGVFHATIENKSKPLNSKILDGKPYFLEIMIKGQTMSPRVPLRTVPYAFTADTAQNCTGNITPTSVSVGGKTIIDSKGTVVGGENDPVFKKSVAYGISSADIISWKTAYGWKNHAGAGYLTSYTETDPVFSKSPAASSSNVTNWNTAYSLAKTCAQRGLLTSNYVPKWSGSALVNSTIYDNGKIGIGTMNPVQKFHVSQSGAYAYAPFRKHQGCW